VAIADDPLTSVVRGVGKMLDEVTLLKRVAAAA
jgi:actin-like ATPase involved in cell morphogenesis